jgi:hypothetical protein
MRKPTAAAAVSTPVAAQATSIMVTKAQEEIKALKAELSEQRRRKSPTDVGESERSASEV